MLTYTSINSSTADALKLYVYPDGDVYEPITNEAGELMPAPAVMNRSEPFTIVISTLNIVYELAPLSYVCSALISADSTGFETSRMTMVARKCIDFTVILLYHCRKCCDVLAQA